MNKENNLINLFIQWAKEEVVRFNLLPQSGSNREYYRIAGKTKTAIGVFNTDLKENRAFLILSKHFKDKGLNVPEIYGEDLVNNIYIQQDLGDQAFYNLVTETWSNGEFPSVLTKYYQDILQELLRFQTKGGENLDFSICYPRKQFDKQSMMWDLNYFKYNFLKLVKVPFDEQLLEDDFHRLSDFLLSARCDFFLYRDFQSRNIMIHENKPFFIDYQGGRQGALQYDVASILYESKTNLPSNIREQLLQYYTDLLVSQKIVEKEEFLKYYHGYTLIRMLQAFGAYGYRGLIENKVFFIHSIHSGIENLRELLCHLKLPLEIPELRKVLDKLIHSEEIKKIISNTQKINVYINSFSYKRGIPYDKTGHGGGFVFDCRSILNPGRFDQYKTKTGMDPEVIDFFEENAREEIMEFKTNAFALVERTLEKFRERNFSELTVNFGCTGGQHRSVFLAEELYRKLKDKPFLSVELHHLEQELKK